MESGKYTVIEPFNRTTIVPNNIGNITANHITMPPPIGVGVSCTLRSPGWSTSPQEIAFRRTKNTASQATNALGTIARVTNQKMSSECIKDSAT